MLSWGDDPTRLLPGGACRKEADEVEPEIVVRGLTSKEVCQVGRVKGSAKNAASHARSLGTLQRDQPQSRAR